MKDSFELKGEWFLPIEPERKLKGLLTYDSKTGGTLDMFDSFSKPSIDIPIILGISDDGKEITLYRSFLRRGWSHFTVNYILIGHHFKTAEELKFDQVISEIFNLGEWVAISGFIKPEISDEETANVDLTLRYKRPSPENFQISDSLSGSFIFISDVPSWSTTYVKDFRMSQRVQLSLKNTSLLSFDDCLKHLFTFANFITLAIYSAAYPNKIILKSKEIIQYIEDDEPQQKKITLHFPVKGRNDVAEEKAWIEMLYWYSAIRENFSDIITTWYKRRDELESTHKLLFEQFYYEGAFNENNFLNLAQAVESFHARLYPGTKLPSDEYKAIREEILALTPEKHHSLLSELFKFGNHLNLHKRLNDVIEKYGNDLIAKSIGDRETFIRKVKNSRNYYTHYSSDLEKKALKGLQLFWLGRKLQMIIVAAYLKETGFDWAFIDKRMLANKNYFVSPFEQ